MTDECLIRNSVEVLHPFQLVGRDGVQPPGPCDDETVEEQLVELSFVPCRRVSTTVAICTGSIAATASRHITTQGISNLAAAPDGDAETIHGQPQI
jgi:hypothetical protein